MKLVIQRVADASVEVDNEIIGQIDKGLMVHCWIIQCFLYNHGWILRRLVVL